MKKVAYLLTLIFALSLISVSCCKDDPEPDPVDEGLITLAELNGDWNFDSYTYNGTEYNCGSVLTSVPNIDLAFINIQFTNTKAYIDDACDTPIVDTPMEYNLTKDLNYIALNNVYEFTVISYVEGTPDVLVLQLDAVSWNYIYEGGTLTLTK